MLIVGSVILCIILSDGLTDFIVKPFVARYRPSWDPFVKYTIDIVNGMRDTQYGFFSAHASNTFCIAMFSHCLYVIEHLLWQLYCGLW